MTWLLDTFEVYEAEMLAIKRGEDPDDLGISHGALGPATRRILANLITLAERFARGKSVEPVHSPSSPSIRTFCPLMNCGA